MNQRVTPHQDLLRIEGLVTTKVDDTSFDDEIFVYAQSLGTARNCPHCGPETIVHAHGRDEGKFKDTSIDGKPTSLVIDRPRFRCLSCRRTWTERIPALRERRMMTRRLEEHIANRCFNATFMQIARDHGIDEGTVRYLFEEHAANKEKVHVFQTPRVLGIDEIHLKKEVPCVLVNVGQRQIYNILPSRTKERVAEYFATMPDKRRVETVVADMWKAYHTLAAEFFPGRLVVVDKFHFLRMAQNGLDLVRKECGRSRTREQKIQLKDERHLLHRRRSKLDDEERAKVNAWLWAFPDLRDAYNAKEALTDAYDAPSRREGEREIARCIQKIPPKIDKAFGEMQTAYANWREPILNYFEDPVTNAYTESVNSIIRELNRVGRGHSFETMRALMLFDETVYTKKTSTRHRRPKDRDDVCGFIGAGGFASWDDDGTDEVRTVTHRADISRLLARLALEPSVLENEED